MMQSINDDLYVLETLEKIVQKNPNIYAYSLEPFLQSSNSNVSSKAKIILQEKLNTLHLNNTFWSSNAYLMFKYTSTEQQKELSEKQLNVCIQNKNQEDLSLFRDYLWDVYVSLHSVEECLNTLKQLENFDKKILWSSFYPTLFKYKTIDEKTSSYLLQRFQASNFKLNDYYDFRTAIIFYANLTELDYDYICKKIGYVPNNQYSQQTMQQEFYQNKALKNILKPKQNVVEKQLLEISAAYSFEGNNFTDYYNSLGQVIKLQDEYDDFPLDYTFMFNRSFRPILEKNEFKEFDFLFDYNEQFFYTYFFYFNGTLYELYENQNNKTYPNNKLLVALVNKALADANSSNRFYPYSHEVSLEVLWLPQIEYQELFGKYPLISRFKSL